MTVVATGEVVASASAAGSAVAAFNVITLEHAEAIAAAAERCERPAILQLSHNAIRWHGAIEPIAAAMRAVAETSTARLGLHLDHIEDVAVLKRAADVGFSSVMYDAGALPYSENVAATTAAVEWAHSAGVWCEAELGHVGGKPDAVASAHAEGVRTDPGEAADFVRRTGVDALAVAVGSRHAMTSRDAALDLDLIAALRAAVPVPLVLHGSSGVGDEDLRAAVVAGMRKINIGTALNIAATSAVRSYLDANPAAVDPRKWLDPGRTAMTDIAAHLISCLAGTG